MGSIATTGKNLEEIVEKMATSLHPNPANGFTCKWDVVVSYSEKSINQNLKARWEELNSPQEPEQPSGEQRETNQSSMDGAETHADPTITADAIIPVNRGRDRDRYRFRLHKLGAPIIQFFANTIPEPSVELRLPVISGTFENVNVETGESLRGGEDSLLKDTYEVRLMGIRLATVVGRYQGESTATDPVTSAPTDANTSIVRGFGKVCVFEDRPSNVNSHQSSQVASVVLDIPLEGNKLGVTVAHQVPLSDESRNQAEWEKDTLEKALENYFLEGTGANKLDLLRYPLTTVRNDRPATTGNVKLDLTPERFQMAVFQPSYDNRPVLSLFIRTVSRKCGITQDLGALWSGYWVGNTICPIPNTHTASIIIHPQLFYEDVIIKSLMKNSSSEGWKFTRIVNNVERGGIAFQLVRQKPLECPQLKIKNPSNSDEVLEIEAWNKNLEKDPATIHICQKQSNKPPVAHIKWKFSAKTTFRFFDMAILRSAAGGECPGFFKTRHNKTTYTLDHTFPLNVNATDGDLQMAIDVKDLQPSWQIEDLEISGDGNCAEQVLEWFHNLGCLEPPEDLMKQRRDLLLGLQPNLDFGTLGLGFFLTTNLLNPGARVINIDKAVGVRIPGNLLLVGSVDEGNTMQAAT